jgi:hypothetical protein
MLMNRKKNEYLKKLIEFIRESYIKYKDLEAIKKLDYITIFSSRSGNINEYLEYENVIYSCKISVLLEENERLIDGFNNQSIKF